jgi:hypothetical protein
MKDKKKGKANSLTLCIRRELCKTGFPKKADDRYWTMTPISTPR